MVGNDDDSLSPSLSLSTSTLNPLARLATFPPGDLSCFHARDSPGRVIRVRVYARIPSEQRRVCARVCVCVYHTGVRKSLKGLIPLRALSFAVYAPHPEGQRHVPVGVSDTLALRVR